MTQIFDKYDENVLNRMIASISEFLRKGFSKNAVVDKFKLPDEITDELIDIARTRIKAKEKFSKPEKMFLNSDDLRWATPEIVSDYRAKRLKCKTIADLGCGIGGQAIYFAKYCKKVIAVEIDKRKIEYAKRNAASFNIKNIEFIHGDIFDEKVIEKVKEADILFCDPYRTESEEERKVEQTAIPRLLSLHENRRIACEAPPQLTPEKINYNCEREYVSINGALNRLTLYFGDLKQCERSAVALPIVSRLENGKKRELKKSDAMKYLHEIDGAVVKADLVGELAYKIAKDIFFYDKTKKMYLLTSDHIIKSDFLKTCKVISKTANKDDEIINALKEANAKEVLLRGSINPNDYWMLRKKYENLLNGKKKAILFLFDKEAIICE